MMIKKLKCFFYSCLMLFFTSETLSAQTENVITKEGVFESPAATLKDIAWIAGHWKCEAFGGTAEEICLPASGGSMSGIFKSVVKGKTNFYEIFSFIEENNTLILKLKHFNDNLIGWEEKGKTIDFKLVKLEKDKVYFSGLTYEKIDKNHFNAYLVITYKDGSCSETKFSYTRVTE